MNNRHSTPMPKDVLEKAQGLLNELKILVEPYMLSLSAEERHSLLKMGDKTLSFVEKSYDYACNYPQFCPSFLNISDFEIDMTDATGLRVLNISARQLADSIEETSMVAGSEAFQAALTFYNSVKQAASQNVPGAKEIYEDLKNRFMKAKRKKE